MFSCVRAKVDKIISVSKSLLYSRVDETRLAELLRAQAGGAGAGEGGGAAPRGVLLGEEWPACGHTQGCAAGEWSTVVNIFYLY